MNNNCLVTGGAGFIGASIVRLLKSKGYDVIVVDDLSNSDGKMINELDVELFKGDISKPEIIDLLKPYTFKYIFNFGSPSTDRFYDLTGRGVCETIKGMLNIAQIAESTGVNSVVYPSSGTVYGNLPAPQSESVKLKPKSLYACTKSFLEDFSATVASETTKYLGLRIFTGFGEGELAKVEFSRSVITLFYLSILKNLSPVIYGDGSQRRDFVYSSDIANIALLGAEKKLSGALNVGSGISHSFNEVIEILSERLGKRVIPKYIESPISHIGETRADISSLLNLLNYKPLRLEEAIDLYLERIKPVEKLYGVWNS
jgi:nucleoside-diphosphate-sugar epimerase